MDGVTREHQRGQQLGGGAGGGQHQPPMGGGHEEVEEESVEAVKQDVHSLKSLGPGPRESVLSPESQGGHWSVGLEMWNSICIFKYVHDCLKYLVTVL